ncbi:hypothetical protein P168DRAFT_130128 [Aspergillus campestris IBT 28561]|uniref:Uncharacterized protein n=1 Tax=Aspergillus campestris (strain IBT 28561) TaxID=1392248 RepID=A0A2I1D786_ASPC2|nr:uncharacterized protein P168DRAFT_130128 [Aspergillus campestris IBT 28561]PKY05742.1 hypothetical protein P168DRAFT_130128 [Aspergillus campestris IBT 28561]
MKKPSTKSKQPKSPSSPRSPSPRRPPSGAPSTRPSSPPRNGDRPNPHPRRHGPVLLQLLDVARGPRHLPGGSVRAAEGARERVRHAAAAVVGGAGARGEGEEAGVERVDVE